MEESGRLQALLRAIRARAREVVAYSRRVSEETRQILDECRQTRAETRGQTPSGGVRNEWEARADVGAESSGTRGE